MMTSQTNLTNHELLVQENDEVARTLIPAMLIVGILMAIGLVGNVLVCLIFGTRLKPGTQNFLIVCLAVFDLLSCVIAMPTEIVDMRYYYMFDSIFACKLFRFVNVFCSMCSILTLTVIAADRYVKVCRPLGRQMTLREARLSVFCSILIGILLSWPALFVFGERTAETAIPGVVGIDCSTSDNIKNTVYPLIYNCVLFVGFIGLTCAFVCIYTKIYKEIRRHKKYMNRVAISTPSSPIASTVEFNFPSLNSDSLTEELPIRKSVTNASALLKLDTVQLENGSGKPTDENSERSVSFTTAASSPDSANNSNDTVSLPPTNYLSINGDISSKVKIIPPPIRLSKAVDYCDGSNTDSSISTCSTPNKKKLKTKTFALGKENRTTIIALLVTTVFVLSYLPYLGLVFATIFSKNFDHQLRGSSLAAFNLFLRFYFVNSAANPIIYGVLNYRFRLELATIVRRIRMYCCKKK